MKTLFITKPCKNLTAREIETLTLIAQGNTRKNISSALYLSEETVKDCIGKILRKLNAINKTNAVSIAQAMQLINPYRLGTDINAQNPQTGGLMVDRVTDSIRQL